MNRRTRQLRGLKNSRKKFIPQKFCFKIQFFWRWFRVLLQSYLKNSIRNKTIESRKNRYFSNNSYTSRQRKNHLQSILYSSAMNCLKCDLIAGTQTWKTTIHLCENCNNNYLWALVSRRKRQLFNHQKDHLEQKLETCLNLMKQTRGEVKKFAWMVKCQNFSKLTKLNLSAGHSL